MHILLMYRGGGTEEALLLSARDGRMRVMRRGQADAVEFREMDGVWVNESGSTVEIGAVRSVATPVYEPDFDHARFRTRTLVHCLGNVRAN